MQQDHTELEEFVGLYETSQILGISRQAITTYMSRGTFPEPYQILASTPLWKRSAIEAFKKEREKRKRKKN